MGWLDPAKPAIEVITDFGGELPGVTALEPKPADKPSASISAVYREAIELGLSRGRNAMAIWQDLVDSQGFTASYQSVQRFVPQAADSNRAGSPGGDRDGPRRGSASRLRLRPYGPGSANRQVPPDPTVRMTLGYSRKCVRFLVFRSSVQIWAELHEKAFRRLGGSTRTVVLDNLREGVLAPDIYDLSLNPLYRDLL